MNEIPKLTLPKELEEYRKQIEKTVQPYVKILASENRTTIYQSKFAGDPYLPKKMEHPKDENNKPMKFLAQLNFEEIPTLENMPNKGILQFFITAEDDIYGLDFNDSTNQKNFKIVFHPHIEKDESLLVTDFSYMNVVGAEYFPIEQEMSLSFSVDYEPVPIENYKRDELINDIADLSEDEEEELWDIYGESFTGEGHKIGGYPCFTQSDPRDDAAMYNGYDIVLLQIDTDTNIMWGDSGVANFFIKKEDLLKLDFSKVMYTWDCC